MSEIPNLNTEEAARDAAASQAQREPWVAPEMHRLQAGAADLTTGSTAVDGAFSNS
jgi:hypothetical protein